MAESDLAERIEAEPVAVQKSDTIRELVNRHKPEFALALADNIDVDKFARIALTAIRNNDKLQEANVSSLMGALMGAAQLGLEPHGPLEHCYLVPYKGEVQLIIGYRGMETLAYRSGIVSSIVARVVREGDHFEFGFGTEEYVSHRPAAGVGGNVTHAYAIAKLVTGGTVPLVMFREDIERARGSSASGKGNKPSGPWATDYDQMARKTAIRALFKDLPASAETQLARGFDERTGSELEEEVGLIIDIPEEEQV